MCDGAATDEEAYKALDADAKKKCTDNMVDGPTVDSKPGDLTGDAKTAYDDATACAADLGTWEKGLKDEAAKKKAVTDAVTAKEEEAAK